MKKMRLYLVTFRIMGKKVLAEGAPKSKKRYTYMDGYVVAESRKKAIEKTIDLIHDETFTQSWKKRNKKVKNLDFSENGKIIYSDRKNNKIRMYYDFHAARAKDAKCS